MKLFLSFARQSMVSMTMYVFEFWMELFGCMLAMYGMYWLWNTLYRSRPELFTVSLDQMVTYAMMAMIVGLFLEPSDFPRWYITNQIRTGDIQMDLLRPLDFFFQMLARTSGMTLYVVAIPCLPAFVLGAVFLGLKGPASLEAGLLFLPSLLLAFLVSFGLQFLMGLVAIYAVSVRRISWVYMSVASFFSGQMVPLWIFPPLLGQIAGLLPFQAMVAIPLSIFIGRLQGPQAVQAIGLQAAWAVVLLVAGRMIWVPAHRRLTVQGG